VPEKNNGERPVENQPTEPQVAIGTVHQFTVLLQFGPVIPERDLKKSISRSILKNTPHPEEGLSVTLALIHGRDFCWPQTVGTWKGTGGASPCEPHDR